MHRVRRLTTTVATRPAKVRALSSNIGSNSPLLLRTPALQTRASLLVTLERKDQSWPDDGAPFLYFSMLGWPGMEQIVSLVRDYMHAEADAGYALLR
jgi:hypothetical protein